MSGVTWVDAARVAASLDTSNSVRNHGRHRQDPATPLDDVAALNPVQRREVARQLRKVIWDANVDL